MAVISIDLLSKLLIQLCIKKRISFKSTIVPNEEEEEYNHCEEGYEDDDDDGSDLDASTNNNDQEEDDLPTDETFDDPATALNLDKISLNDSIIWRHQSLSTWSTFTSRK